MSIFLPDLYVTVAISLNRSNLMDYLIQFIEIPG
jgi:hypothetical protein